MDSFDDAIALIRNATYGEEVRDGIASSLIYCKNDHENQNTRIDEQNNIIDKLKEEIVDVGDTINISDLSSGKYLALYQNRRVINNESDPYNTIITNANSLYTPQIIDLTDYLGGTLKIVMSSIKDDGMIGSTRKFGFVDSINDYTNPDNVVKVVECWRENDLSIFEHVGDEWVANIPITGIGFLFSCQNTVSRIEITPYKYKFYNRDETNSMIGKRKAYVSSTGSDSYDGTKTHPYATVNKALSSGANVILISAGNYPEMISTYDQNINLSYSESSNIEIRNITPNGRVIFQSSDSIVCTSEEKVTGYNKVYSCQSDKVYPNELKWLWQNNCEDSSTEINDSERHPLQRGYSNRVLDTKILRCSSSNDTEEALSEIDSYDGYKWYYDSDNSILYFSRPEAVSSNYPICGDFGFSLFLNPDRSKTIKMYGIETKYMRFNVDDLTGVELYDCKSAHVFGGGAFTYNRCISAKFVRCEATGCQYSSTGDGFNGHANKTGQKYAKQTTISLIDCWSHDNNDDGYSDHERSEISIFGGLFEYNGKAGVTPSYGSHCTCYNVLSRNNYNGFFYTGEADQAEGGKYGQLICYACVARNNLTGSGFRVSHNGNRVTLVNCKSINNLYGYMTDDSSYMELVDCGSSDISNNNIKIGNIIISNTNMVVS